MVPVPIAIRNSHSSRLLHILFTVGTQYVSYFIRLIFFKDSEGLSDRHPFLVRRHEPTDPKSTKFIVFATLIPLLVLLSGLFAGLTLGYMSLDETQLNVLSISGTPEQRKYAKQIMPVRKNGHLLLVTLLLVNMIVNETLPVIADPVLGGGVQGVIVSTALIVIFAEIIPQSLFTRHGLYLGAKMAWFTRFLIFSLCFIAWPVAKLLEFALGPHHGIIYRRAELKELIAMHSSQRTHGGDLKTDTVTIIGATLDLQEKVVKQAMTPIEDVFMLSIDSKLDYDLLKRICQNGHSRVPVYEEIEVPARAVLTSEDGLRHEERNGPRTMKVKKIIGILLVKQCVLLDPKDATPLRKIPLNKVPFVPNNEPLLGILDKFQEGRSHMAIVSRFSVEKAASVKKAVKRGLTQRLRARVGMGDTDSDTNSDEDEKTYSVGQKKRRRNIHQTKDSSENIATDGPSDTAGNLEKAMGTPNSGEKTLQESDVVCIVDGDQKHIKEEGKRGKTTAFQLPKIASGMTSMSMLEQSMPADAVLTKEGAAEFLQSFEPAVMPLGIITLEDVLEELIGEEIYDEFDKQGAHGDPYHVPPVQDINIVTEPSLRRPRSASVIQPDSSVSAVYGQGSQGKATSLMGLGFFRTRSAPPVPGDQETQSQPEVEISNDREIDSSNDTAIDEGTTLVMPRPVHGVSHNTPSIILEQHSNISLSDKPSTLAVPDSGPLKVLPPTGTAVSRVNPPATTLEAILLDRKRRLAAQVAGGATSGSHGPNNPPQGSSVTESPILHKDFAFVNTSASPSLSTLPASEPVSRPSSVRGGISGGGKGTKFKSSRLGGGERTGVVVAEQVGGAYTSEIGPDQETKTLKD